MSIHRHITTKRHSQCVVHEQTIYLAGVTAPDRSAEIAGQTRQVFDVIDALLQSQQAQRTDLLSAQVWLKNIEEDFATFNSLWEIWMPEGHAPVRAVVEANMAAPNILVEVMVVAARSLR